MCVLVLTHRWRLRPDRRGEVRLRATESYAEACVDRAAEAAGGVWKLGRFR